MSPARPRPWAPCQFRKLPFPRFPTRWQISSHVHTRAGFPRCRAMGGPGTQREAPAHCGRPPAAWGSVGRKSARAARQQSLLAPCRLPAASPQGAHGDRASGGAGRHHHGYETCCAKRKADLNTVPHELLSPSGSANNGPRSRPAPHLSLLIKYYWQTVVLIHLITTHGSLCGAKAELGPTETTWSTRPDTFTFCLARDWSALRHCPPVSTGAQCLAGKILRMPGSGPTHLPAGYGWKSRRAHWPGH